MIALQADLFQTEAPAAPQPKTWYPARFVSWDYITSPTRGEMRRLIGEILRGPCAGIVCYKPLTHTFEGVRWAERSLKALYASTRTAELELTKLRRPGLGHYLDELCKALVACGEFLHQGYAFQHATGIYWTVERVKRLT